jgi:dTDP-4-amino-4,6-dideoxygalactose transaminase
MINWVPEKKIDKVLVENLLQKTELSNQFSNYGPNCQILEKYIKDNFKIDDNKSIIVVTNGAVALHALTKGIEYVEKNIKWATQSFTFPSSAQGNLSTIEIVDVDLDGGLDLDILNKDINGIIVTNIFGNVVDIAKYINWSNKDQSKFVIFDNAATSYTFYNGKNCLNYGHGCTISFHHTKPFGFAEGGAIIVNSKYEYAIRCIINFGIGLSDNYWNSIGNNYKMSDISAIYILQFLLNNFNKIINKHFNLYNYFNKIIEQKKIIKFKLFKSYHDEIIVPSCFCLIFKNYNEELISILNNNNIFCRKYYNPLKNTKNTTDIYNSILCIPCTTDMSYNDIDRIILLLLC